MLVMSAVIAALMAACGRSEPAPATSGSAAAPTSPTAPPATTPVLDRSFPDLAYADVSPAQRLDLYVPGDAPPPIPVLMYVHGGMWSTGDKTAPEYAPLLQPILRHGYAVASINYRLSGEAKFPAQIQDAKAAVRWLRANASGYGLDPDRIAAFGDSSGGHLVALLGSTNGLRKFEAPWLGNAGVSSRVQAVVDWFGPVNLLTMDRELRQAGFQVEPGEGHDAADSPESQLFGAPIQSIPARVRAANPVTYLRPGRRVPPFLIAHGDLDSVVPLQQSITLRRAIVRAAGPGSARLVVVRGSGHWVDFDSLGQLPVLLAFLDGVLT
jgi:acetyl esterase/lipase